MTSARSSQIAERSEGLVHELRAEAERLSLRNAELSAQHAAATQRANAASQAERDEVARSTALAAEAREARERASRLSAELARLRGAEKAHAHERKVMARQLQRAQVLAEAPPAGAAPPGAVAAAVAAGASAAAAATAPKPAAGESVEEARRARRVERERRRDAREAASEQIERTLAEARLQQRSLPVA